MKGQTIRHILDQKFKQYNQPEFIVHDPISIPHMFQKKQDIEISGLFAAVFAWGQRPTIIQKCKDLMQRMDYAPHQFVLGHHESDLKKLIGFKHRTFNDTDLLYFVWFLNFHYKQHASLEEAFQGKIFQQELTVEQSLNYFRNYFFDRTPECMSDREVPPRTLKHIASPERNSACKRLNMYLRWMVRNDQQGVDFGIWSDIKTSQLICPLDLHVGRVSRKLGLLKRPQDDWQAALELTANLRKLDKKDPVKYDFALFGMGIEKEIF